MNSKEAEESKIAIDKTYLEYSTKVISIFEILAFKAKSICYHENRPFIPSVAAI